MTARTPPRSDSIETGNQGRSTMEKRPALGKGLSALIPDTPLGPPQPGPLPGVLELEVDRLTPNDYQPRLNIDDARLEQLAASIRANGVIQPIVVRKVDDGYRIIAGERRWRAARLAGLTRVPVVVKEVSGDATEQRVLQMALVENIQRDDLNPIDEAKAYRRLADEFTLTQEAIASAVGKDRATVANTLRLLKLPGDVQELVASGELSMGHARALLALAGEQSQRQVAREVKARGLSVRETEALVKRELEGASRSRTSRPAAPAADVHTRAAEDKLKLQLGTRVRIKRKGKGGRIEIDFTSEDELIRIYEALTER
ncbi:MAG TPA: ParB/RepB/Spo0J family partition protein [Steroidobacteraceae bacterium]|nr:ParB/RepB/Spo0J family partition protein [Steroidobacteraceae bacterium]